MKPPELSYQEWLAVASAFVALAAEVGDLPAAAQRDALELAMAALARLNVLERGQLMATMMAVYGDALDDLGRDRSRHLQRDFFGSEVRSELDLFDPEA